MHVGHRIHNEKGEMQWNKWFNDDVDGYKVHYKIS